MLNIDWRRKILWAFLGKFLWNKSGCFLNTYNNRYNPYNIIRTIRTNNTYSILAKHLCDQQLLTCSWDDPMIVDCSNGVWKVHFDHFARPHCRQISTSSKSTLWTISVRRFQLLNDLPFKSRRIFFIRWLSRFRILLVIGELSVDVSIVVCLKNGM